jgi:CBS domain containing-hemolysin-like protein
MTIDRFRKSHMTSSSDRRARTAIGIVFGVMMALSATPSHASMFKGEALDTAANVLAWVVLVIVPIVGITVFWLVHILPEKVAEKKRHPQAKAIQVLCLLSLVFGGLLWPLAWLWAYSKPVMYKMAYGTDVADEEHGAAAKPGPAETATGAAHEEIARLRERLAQLEARASREARG